MPRAAILLIVMGLAVGACGQDSSTSTTTAAGSTLVAETQSPVTDVLPETTAPLSDLPSEFDPCELLAADEVAEALGSDFGRPVSEITPPQYFCTYDGGEGEAVMLGLHIHPSAEVAMLAYNSAIDLNGYPVVAELGDAAFVSQPDGDLIAIQGQYEVSIDLSFVDQSDEQQVEIATGLATKALAALP